MLPRFFTMLLLLMGHLALAPPAYTYQIALLKYRGGGDWYANPTGLTNLAAFANQTLQAGIDPEYATIEVISPDLYNYPFVHMTGHGNVVFSPEERQNLRGYLAAGGFLHIDDNYGMDPYIRPELAKLFPEKTLEPVPATHPIFQAHFAFPEGLPKIHEHDQKPPEAWAFQIEGRIALLYTHESDLGDGWEDQAVHNDPPAVRQKALRMGLNILHYAFIGSDESVE